MKLAHRPVCLAAMVLLLGIGVANRFELPRPPGGITERPRRGVEPALGSQPVLISDDQTAGGPRSQSAAGLFTPLSGASAGLASWRAVLSAEPKFAEFAAWTAQYLEATPAIQAGLEADGVRLAAGRRDKMLDLLQANPKRALELSVPGYVCNQLPLAVRALLEERVSRRGDLAVLAVLPEPGAEGAMPPIYRTASIDGVDYRAFVYGRRLEEPTRENISINGVALDGLLAVHEDPVRILDSEEAAEYRRAAAPESICLIDGESFKTQSAENIWVQLEGEILALCGEEHAEHLNQDYITAESSHAPVGATGPPLAASSWTEGIKKLILIRVDFSDLTGEPLTEAAGAAMVSNVHAFYQEMSYGKAGFALVGAGSEVTPTFRLERTADYYGGVDPSRLRTDARTAARAAGYDLADFNLDVICLGAVPGFRFSGLAYVGAAGAWLRNNFSTGVAAHELGHNFGLNHANFWDTAGQSVIGNGTSVEYGDSFDTMGSANAGSKHFNARYKNQLNWIPMGGVAMIAESGPYRIAAHDDPEATGARALRIVRNSRTNYWVEFRQRYTSNKWLMDGVGLRWAGNGREATRLLDTTPGSGAGKDDSAILFGRTFSDRPAGIHITPIGKAGTQPESVEVMVHLGTFADNTAPLIALAGPANTAANTDLVFHANAADPDGDTLAYHWDFGDGNFGANQPEARHRWSAAGEYVVRCVVSDMKGGQASDALVVRVGTPSTFRISGRVATGDGAPLEGVRVYVSSTRMTYTDSSGGYHLVGLGPGGYTLRASLEDHLFIHQGFLNPIQVGPSKVQADFVAVPPDGRHIKSLISAGSTWLYLDDGSNPGTVWRDVEFDDRAWNEGPAPLGYGDDNEKTVVSFGSNPNNKHVTTYFRRQFIVETPGLFSLVTVSLRRDDGGIVYLNGREVFRSNMPAGNITSTTLASSAVGGADERAFFQADLDPALLQSGTNVLAVEIHQASRTSSDLVFDLELFGTEAAGFVPPALTWSIAGQHLALSWPLGPGDWVLHSSAELGPASAWSMVSPAPVSHGDQRTILLPLHDSQRFYRLVLP